MPAAAERDEILVCHASDLHVPLAGPAPLWSLAGKRALGWANLALFRGKSHRRDGLEDLLSRMAREEPDLAVVTGDITNLSLDSELREASDLLRSAGLKPDRTVVLPGNHDRYTPLSDSGDAFERGMGEWLPPGFGRRGGYPIVKRVGPVVFAGLDTAVWRGPIRAAGRLDSGQVERLSMALSSEENASLWPVLAMHHPPFRLEGPLMLHYRAGLAGYEALGASLGPRGATVLHGHLHCLIRRREDQLDVIGVPSASHDSGEEATQLGYNVYAFRSDGIARAHAVRLWPEPGGGWREERREIPTRARRAPLDVLSIVKGGIRK